MTRRALMLLPMLLASACGAGPGPGQVMDRTRLDAEEIERTGAGNAYDAIVRARPEYLRLRGSRWGRGPTPADYPTVYLNATRYGTVESLRTITVGDIVEIRYYSATDATTRFGTGHATGVIQILTR